MGRITLAHGAGGRESEELIKRLFKFVKLRKVPNGTGLDEFDDGAFIPLSKHIVFTIDSYTVDPIFFPGGDIGKLAAAGSINDVCVMGAEPIAALDSIVVEEGFPLDQLNKIIKSMITTFENENVAILGGDLKVMPKGKIDKIVITTAVIGYLNDSKELLLDSKIRPGDKLIVSGTIGEHGAVITAFRMGIEAEFEGLKSDCEPVTKVMRTAKEIGGIHAAKDPTRGGLAMALNEFAQKSNITLYIDEEKIPIREEVNAFCEMLGIDPLFLACEGRVLIAVDSERADELLSALRRAGYDKAEIIGEARRIKGREGFVILRTRAGGLRIVEKPTGELTPRIC